MLRSAGLELTIVEDGGAAVAAVLDAERSGRPFGLVLMDMQMPVLDGYGATKALRAEGWHGAIVAVTAHSMSDERERCLAAGCDDYLSKPVDRAGLLATVARHLGTPTAEAPEAAQA
jgi:CheY-like chemotaxis protein